MNLNQALLLTPGDSVELSKAADVILAVGMDGVDSTSERESGMCNTDHLDSVT